ncbi:MAG TPA: Ig-like domain-containing protein [Saprospiraceae bacterium]|nr:Ig-like domain-containing protein [Saprospiraceae bacterium]
MDTYVPSGLAAAMYKLILVMLLVLHGVLFTSISAQPVLSHDPEPYFEIAGRIRNGDWAFESSLNIAVPTGQQGGGQWQMNPDGLPVWNSEGNTYGDIHSFSMSFTQATGTILWQIDFNRDGDFEDFQETKSMPVAWFAEKGFTYISVYGQGNDEGLTIALKELTINNVYFGDYTSSSETPFNLLFEDQSGVFNDIVVTGRFSFSGGNGFERPRLWVRLGKPNKRPFVDLTYPLEGTLYGLMDSIQMKAMASDPDGKIRYVEFYADDVKIGEDFKFPYQYTWINITEGFHTLKAKAVDHKGAIAFSTPVNVFYGDNLAPTCIISNLEDRDTLYDPDTLTIKVISIDPNDGVHYVNFYSDSVLIGTDSVAPYMNAALLNPPMGMYTLRAKSTDYGGMSTMTAPVRVTVRCIREDIDNNGTVNTLDFLLLLAAYGKVCFHCAENVNDDGVVSTIDFLSLLAKFGYTCI